MVASNDHTKLVPEFIHNLFVLSSSILFLFSQPLVRVLSVPYELMVPDHTRDALFQLCCDLRANPIKDKHWVLVHWRRLKPRTFPGWIAMGWAALFVASAGTGVAGMLLCGLLGVLYTLGFILASAGVVGSLVVGMLLTCAAFWCFIAACITGFMCTGAGFAYCGTSTVWAVLGFLGSKLASQSSPQDAALKPPPTLSPVATPRAASPRQASGLPEKEALLRGSPGHPNALPAINPGSPRFAAVPPVATGLACGSVSSSQEMTNPVLEDAELEAGIAEQIANAKAILEETSKPSATYEALGPLAQPAIAKADTIEDTSKPSTISEALGPLAQPVDAKADMIGLADSMSPASSASILAKSPAEALQSPHAIGVVSSKPPNRMDDNGGPAKHAKNHKSLSSKAQHLQRKGSPPAITS